MGLCRQYPAQIVALSAQISWSGSVLAALRDAQGGSGGGLKACLEGLAWRLLAMSESVLGESPPALRKKYEQLITELVRQRDATRTLQVRALDGSSRFFFKFPLWILFFFLDSSGVHGVGYRMLLFLKSARANMCRSCYSSIGSFAGSFDDVGSVTLYPTLIPPSCCGYSSL